jgi:hypothetical protein
LQSAPSAIRSTALLLALAGCSAPRPPEQAQPPAPPAAKSGSDWVLTPSGFGLVQIGWTVAQLNAALGDSVTPTYEISDQCDQLVPAAFPQGTSLMVIGDTVVRVDVYEPGILTPEGMGVGVIEARLLEVYGPRAAVTPHKYSGPDGHYVTVPDATDPRRMTIFETDGATVLDYRAGLAPGVQYVEGCA